jgi:phage repressor protein C with HTH and peptisase S24 domain
MRDSFVTRDQETVTVGWANNHIAKLQAGEVVQFRPRGNSMTPKIESGQLCTVVPLAGNHEVEEGDIVLCKVNGNQYLHLVKAIQGKRLQIGNNHGRINGWTSRQQIYGKLTKVE